MWMGMTQEVVYSLDYIYVPSPLTWLFTIYYWLTETVTEWDWLRRRAFAQRQNVKNK